MAEAADVNSDLDMLLLKRTMLDLVDDPAGAFLHRVRNHEKHEFLENMPSEGPSSCEAVEEYADFITPILAQFCVSGIPRHAAFKAVELILLVCTLASHWHTYICRHTCTHTSNTLLQATLVYIAKTYGIFEHGTRAKTIKASGDVLYIFRKLWV